MSSSCSNFLSVGKCDGARSGAQWGAQSAPSSGHAMACRKKLRFPSPGGEGGPRRAFSPAVAGRMRGLFSSGPPPTNNIPSSSPTRSPIFEAGECRGHSEGAKRENETLDSCSRHLSLCSCPAIGSRECARVSRTGIDRAYWFASPSQRVPGFLSPLTRQSGSGKVRGPRPPDPERYALRRGSEPPFVFAAEARAFSSEGRFPPSAAP